LLAKTTSCNHFAPPRKYQLVAVRAGLNEREAPGKVVTARPPKVAYHNCIAFHMSSFQLCKRTGQKRQSWYSLEAYTFQRQLGWPCQSRRQGGAFRGL